MIRFSDLLKFLSFCCEYTSGCLIYITLEMQYTQNILAGKIQVILFE